MKSPELNSGQNPNVLQSSSLNEKGFGTFARTTYPPETKFPKGDARNEVFYQPARPVPVERPVTVEPPTSKKALIGRLAASLAIIATMGGGLGAQHHIEAQEELSLPGIGRDIGAIPQTTVKDYHLLLQKIGAEIVVPTVVDRKATQGIIGPANSVLITAQEYEKVAPPVIEGDSVNIPFPIKSKDGKIPNIQYQLTGTFGIPRTIIKDGVEQKIQVDDAIVFSGIRPGDILLSPITGKIYHSRAGIDLKNPNGGEWEFSIKGTDEYGNKVSIRITTVALKPLINTPERGDYKNIADIPTVDIKMGDPIGEILTSSDNRLFAGQVKVSTVSGIKEPDGTYTGGPANARISANSGQKAFVLQ